MHEGRRGIICGAGTSLSSVPKEIADNPQNVLICINSSGLHFDHYDYLFITDVVYAMTYWEDVCERADNIVMAYLGLTNLYDKCKLKYPGKNIYLMDRRYDDQTNFAFTDDRLLCGLDACHSATQLAWVMGLRPIVLCGIDLCWVDGKRYFNDRAFDVKKGSGLEGLFDEIHTSYKRNENQIGYESDLALINSMNIWHQIWEKNPSVHDKIFNASPISKLPYFQKVDISSYICK